MEPNDSRLVGDVNCLNCGRTLAQAVRSVETGRLRLRRAPHQAVVYVELVNRHILRCKRCSGRAFIERLLLRDIAPEADDGQSDHLLAGAA